MKRLKIAIIFASKPNFKKDAFKYFILTLNKVQGSYEFYFPDTETYVFEEGIVDYKKSNNSLLEYVLSNRIEADHTIGIISGNFNNYFFFNATEKTSVITTDIWNDYYTPPSLFEYLAHCMYTCLIYSKVHPDPQKLTDRQRSIVLDSHKETRGCIADFTRQKEDRRLDIIMGYVCEEHEKEIEEYYGQNYLDDVKKVVRRTWIGTIEETGSVAYNLKHVYKFDINRDSGFNKNLWDHIKDKFYEIPGAITLDILKIIIGALLIYYLIQLGIVEKP